MSGRGNRAPLRRTRAWCADRARWRAQCRHAPPRAACAQRRVPEPRV